jgi:hypothetical protein
MNAYTEREYWKDVELMGRCARGRNDDAMGRLEILMSARGSKELYMGHEALPKFLSMSTAFQILDNEAVLVGIIMKQRDVKDMPSGELRQWRDECMSLILRRVENTFSQRYRGAQQRVERYERRVFNPHFNELRTALRLKDADRVYAAAERICIMTENFSAEHPIVREYEALRPNVEDIVNNWNPSNN